MKISYVRSKGVRKINISHHVNNRGKIKNKMFDSNDISNAMNYAVTIHDDIYISTCTNDILDWCERNEHIILRKKSWIFA